MSVKAYLLTLKNKDMSIALYTCLSRTMLSIIASLIKHEYVPRIRFAYLPYYKEALSLSDLVCFSEVPAFHGLWNKSQPRCTGMTKRCDHIFHFSLCFPMYKFIGLQICSFFYILCWKFQKKYFPKEKKNCTLLCTMLQITHIKSFFLFNAGIYKGKLKICQAHAISKIL